MNLTETKNSGIAMPVPRAPHKEPKQIGTKKIMGHQIAKYVVIFSITLASIVLTTVDLIKAAREYVDGEKMRKDIENNVDTSLVIENLQVERGMTVLLTELRSLKPQIPGSTMNSVNLTVRREETVKSVSKLENWQSNKTFTESSFLRQLRDYRAKIDDVRQRVTSANQVEHYTAWVEEFMSWLPKYIESRNFKNFANIVFSYQLLIRGKEEMGLRQMYGSLRFLQGKHDNEKCASKFYETLYRANFFLAKCLSFSTEMSETYEKLIHTEEAQEWMARKNVLDGLLLDEQHINESSNYAMEWFEILTKNSNLLLKLQDHGAHIIQERIRASNASSMKWLIFQALLVVFMLFVVPAIIVSLIRVQNQILSYSSGLFRRVRLEQGKTEFLCANIEPGWSVYADQP